MYNYRCRTTPINEMRLGNRPSVIYTEQLSQGGPIYECIGDQFFHLRRWGGKCRAAAAVAFGAWLGGRMRNVAMQALRSEAGVKKAIFFNIRNFSILFYCMQFYTSSEVFVKGNKWCVMQLPW